MQFCFRLVTLIISRRWCHGMNIQQPARHFDAELVEEPALSLSNGEEFPTTSASFLIFLKRNTLAPIDPRAARQFALPGQSR